MSRSKTVGLTFAVVFAMTALVASAAQAATFMSEGNVNTLVKASQATKHVFTVEGSKVECEQATFESEGEIAMPAETVVVHPLYKECTAFGFVGATVTTTGCNYAINATGTVGANPDEVNAHLNVECSGTNKIVITAGTCELTVPSQKELANIRLTNNTAASPKTVTLTAEVTGIKATKVKDGFACPLNGTGEATGTYTGTATVTGFHGGAPVGVTVE